MAPAQILVVDDDPTTLKLLAKYLGKKGYSVTPARDGEEALTLFRQSEFDLVITDLRMPRLDGLEVLRRIKALRPTVEVLVLTGHGTMTSAIAALRDGGACDYLLKPLASLELLGIAVKRALDKQRLALVSRRPSIGSPARILLVGDDLSVKQGLREALADEGYTVLEARDGEEALSRRKDSPPDLILVDMTPPYKDGFQACRTLKADAPWSGIPLIVVIPKTTPEALTAGLEAGADDCLFKPVDRMELSARVQAHLRSKRRHDDLERETAELSTLLEISQATSSTLRSKEIFQIIVSRTTRITGVIRCSLVLIEGKEGGYVVAASDNPSIQRLPISLKRYPEIREVLRVRRPVVIEDVFHDPLMAEVRETLYGKDFTSTLVVPIILREEVVGALLLRAARQGWGYAEREVRLCEIIAEIAAIALHNAHLFESLELANLSLERLTLIDELTETYNRRFFFRRLEEEFQRASRYGYPLSCIMIDVDHFKEVNDTLGHRQGDLVLKGLADAIVRTVRKTDMVARYGGEEFAVLLPMTFESGAFAQAERIRKAVRDFTCPALEGSRRITVSLGVATYPHPRVKMAEELIQRADEALYRAKLGGRDRVFASVV